MKPLPAHSVLDASALIKVILLEEFTGEMREHFLHIGVDADVHAPDLLPIECANILWKQVMRNGYDALKARQDLVDLLQFAVKWYPTIPLLPRACEIAVEHSITAYDAAYLTLAEELNMPVLTADDRLAKKVAGQFDIISLSDYFATKPS